MQNPELDVRQVRTTGADTLFFDLIEPFLNGGRDRISPYRLKHVIPGNEGTAYAVYEVNHNILAVQCYLGDELLTFGDDETVQFMSMEEIRLVRDLGEVAIDGVPYIIKSMTFNIIDGAVGCQHMIVFCLENKC